MMHTVAARPFAYRFDPAVTALVVIDMQRDFIEPGGFGDALGNDVRLLEGIVPTVRRLLDVCRASGMLIVHTREAHRADLSDCPPSKRNRGDAKLRPFLSLPFDELLVGMAPFDGGAPRYLALDVGAASARALFEGPAVRTDAGRAAWLDLYEGAALQPLCEEYEGINLIDNPVC